MLESYLISMQLRIFQSINGFDEVTHIPESTRDAHVAVRVFHSTLTYVQILTPPSRKLCVSETWLAVSRQHLVLVVFPTSFANVNVCQNMI